MTWGKTADKIWKIVVVSLAILWMIMLILLSWDMSFEKKVPFQYIPLYLLLWVAVYYIGKYLVIYIVKIFRKLTGN